MSDLDQLRAAAVPRPSKLCRRLSRRIDSILGFIAYGLLWFFVSALVATAALFAVIAVVGPSPGAIGRTAALVAWAAGMIGSWVLFGWWVRRRLGPSVRLFRDGAFVQARVHTVRHLSVRGAPFTYASLRFDDDGHERRVGLSIGGHPAEVREGAMIPVLFVPDYGYCAAFPMGGRVVPAALAKLA